MFRDIFFSKNDPHQGHLQWKWIQQFPTLASADQIIVFKNQFKPDVDSLLISNKLQHISRNKPCCGFK